MNRILPLVWFVAVGATCGVSLAQSSSLYVNQNTPPPPPARSINGVIDRLSPHISRASLSAVRMPAPRQFAVHDLITVIVRESIENSSDSELQTEKDTTIKGLISAFPNLKLNDLANLQLRPSTFDKGNPQLNLSLSQKFEGEGEYERKDTFTTRITARVIDVKPNGTIVLEARKFIQSDEENVSLLLTGTCRKDDITGSNTILSTQIYDLRLIKEHAGQVRNASKKGLITRFFELIFNF